MALLIHLLACAFGLGSWVAVNGLWVELPLIVNTLPEGWELPSYLTVIIQLANLGPLLVTLMHKLCPGRLKEKVVIYSILSIGIVSCVLLAFFWDKTTIVAGASRSTAFFIITFFLSLVDCTSSVTFLPFMMQLPAKYVTTLAAFIALNRLPRTYELSTENLVPDTVASVSSGLDNPGAETDGKGVKCQAEGEAQSKLLQARSKHSVYQMTFIYFLVVWANAATNGLLPSVQTYSCMPYGNLAYHLSAALSSVANPLACTIAMFFQKRSLVFLGALTVLGTGFGSYNMAMAAMSPCPLLQGSAVGETIIVLSWLFFTGTLTYVKVMVGVILRDRSHIALVWCGAASQMGSLVGSVTMFPLVNVYQLFKSGDFCNTKCPL
ncbi:Solute carrier family 52, riboflavin transporter, member 3-A Riboflavin transporter 2-A [Larimichthys crocea]|uniref:Riboflavin transporter n=1 Tax=Larimichthys crocea TaxID=215358 RepID=A0A6G0INV2_LARCR|nr:Solute carrier family 52, riboflavin transporter, member 3-A Riboflavin transporter 2-A [Larimichthys crocea]